MTATLIIECGLPIDYVMDTMRMYEAIQLLKYKHLRKKDDWEMSRWHNTLYINAHSKRRFKVEEVLQFPWEKEDKQIESKSAEEIEIERKAAIEESQRIASMIAPKNNEESGD